jgi:hypothetical protein
MPVLVSKLITFDLDMVVEQHVGVVGYSLGRVWQLQALMRVSQTSLCQSCQV